MLLAPFFLVRIRSSQVVQKVFYHASSTSTSLILLSLHLTCSIDLNINMILLPPPSEPPSVPLPQVQVSPGKIDEQQSFCPKCPGLNTRKSCQ